MNISIFLKLKLDPSMKIKKSNYNNPIELFEIMILKLKKAIGKNDSYRIMKVLRQITRTIHSKEQKIKFYNYLLTVENKSECIMEFAKFYRSDAKKNVEYSLSACKLLLYSILQKKYACNDYFDILWTLFIQNYENNIMEWSHFLIFNIEKNLLTFSQLNKIMEVSHSHLFSFTTEITFYFLKIIGSIMQKDVVFADYAEKKFKLQFLDILEHSICPVNYLATQIKNKNFFERYEQFLLKEK